MTTQIDISHQMGDFALEIAADLPTGVTAIFGASGAGKTSILRILAGLMTPARGRITVAGTPWLDTETGIDLRPAARRVGYVFQEPRLFPHLSVEANLRYGMGRAQAADLDGMLGLLGLEALRDRHPARLSGGEAQRVALGRALLSEPHLLLLDEPLSALDQPRRREIMPYFERLRDQRNIPILYVSHDIDEVARLADRMILLDHGTVAAAGPVADVLAQAAPGSSAGRAIAGGLLVADIMGYEAGDGLTCARIGTQNLWLPGRVGAVGERVRLRVDARDVTLALAPPAGLSALNILKARITAIEPGAQAGALVRLDHQGQAFCARLTQRSVAAMALREGRTIYAILKSMRATPERVGGA